MLVGMLKFWDGLFDNICKKLQYKEAEGSQRTGVEDDTLALASIEQGSRRDLS